MILVFIVLHIDHIFLQKRKCSWSSSHCFWGLHPQALLKLKAPTTPPLEKEQHQYELLGKPALLCLQHNLNKIGGILLMCLMYISTFLLHTLAVYSLIAAHFPLAVLVIFPPRTPNTHSLFIVGMHAVIFYLQPYGWLQTWATIFPWTLHNRNNGAEWLAKRHHWLWLDLSCKPHRDWPSVAVRTTWSLILWKQWRWLQTLRRTQPHLHQSSCVTPQSNGLLPFSENLYYPEPQVGAAH